MIQARRCITLTVVLLAYICSCSNIAQQQWICFSSKHPVTYSPITFSNHCSSCRIKMFTVHSRTAMTVKNKIQKTKIKYPYMW